MTEFELKQILEKGEDSQQQFKQLIVNGNALAAEMVAFSNSLGGKLLVGVNDDGQITGLSLEQSQALNQLISNTASHSVRPPINPMTENIKTAQGLVIIIRIKKGLNKPYMDTQGFFWVKSGADKRRVTAREEIQRMYQSANLVHADVMPVPNMGIEGLDRDYFNQFVLKQYGDTPDDLEISSAQLLSNMNLMQNGIFNVAGALLFSKTPQSYLPVFNVKAVAYPSENIHLDAYIESQDITGKLENVFQESLAFLLRQLRRLQNQQNVNSMGKLEIPKSCLEELLINALIHRDYFISASIRLFVFTNRIEIISPGHLPNSLTIEHIKNGNSNIRNPVLASFAAKILPYRGLGNGIRRALRAYPDIELIDNRDENLFKVVIKRPPL
ncbi:MAG: putative DNA binding domain-containing protein [Methylococcales bacterium]|nr:putative DNA binding domain-containing protein [Methylococcales bacterium]